MTDLCDLCGKWSKEPMKKYSDGVWTGLVCSYCLSAHRASVSHSSDPEPIETVETIPDVYKQKEPIKICRFCGKRVHGILFSHESECLKTVKREEKPRPSFDRVVNLGLGEPLKSRKRYDSGVVMTDAQEEKWLEDNSQEEFGSDEEVEE